MKKAVLQVEVKSEAPHQREVLTDAALEFVVGLHRAFNTRRKELLAKRKSVQKELDSGKTLHFLQETANIRKDPSWHVPPPPKDLTDRKVEITGPVDRKMMINAFNSGANVFMADFEDSLSPTWTNVIEGQFNLREAVRGTLSFASPEGKNYALAPTRATLMVRPRGWHLEEKHLLIDGEQASASLFDFGLFFFHNAQELIKRGSGPYFYLPKMESHFEARLWNAIFCFAQDYFKIPRGTIRATVLIETIPAAFQMEEILYELKEHSAGLNAGRWDFIFSIIKRFHAHRDFIFPDRGQVTMTVPFMLAYANLLVQTCHKRKAHAMGGMSAFIPSRKDPQVNEIALKKVREDKLREVKQGFDGTWVAHPDLVPVAQEIFKEGLAGKPNQIALPISKEVYEEKALLNFQVPGEITEKGIRQNIHVTLQYLAAWLSGTGAVAIDNLMEDAATAEISRSQLWQWVHRQKVTPQQVETIGKEELDKLLKQFSTLKSELDLAGKLLHQVVLEKDFPEFLTLLAYKDL